MSPAKRYAIRLLRSAEEDLSEIVDYLGAENRTAAAKTLAKIEKNLSLLSTQPTLGRVPHDPEIVPLGYRYLIVLDYLIFYKVEEQTIYVHRIIHGARQYLQLL